MWQWESLSLVRVPNRQFCKPTVTNCELLCYCFQPLIIIYAKHKCAAHLYRTLPSQLQGGEKLGLKSSTKINLMPSSRKGPTASHSSSTASVGLPLQNQEKVAGTGQDTPSTSQLNAMQGLPSHSSSLNLVAGRSFLYCSYPNALQSTTAWTTPAHSSLSLSSELNLEPSEKCRSCASVQVQEQSYACLL